MRRTIGPERNVEAAWPFGSLVVGAMILLACGGPENPGRSGGDGVSGSDSGPGGADAKAGSNADAGADPYSDPMVRDFGLSAQKLAYDVPACPAGNALLTVAMEDLDKLVAISPMGGLNPTGGHVFPVTHQYVTTTNTSSSNPSQADTVDLHAPARLKLLGIQNDHFVTSGFSRDDYFLSFFVCNRVVLYLGHVGAMSPAFAAKVGPLTSNCSTDSHSPGSSDTVCGANPDGVWVDVGELIGQHHGDETAMFDYRVTPLSEPDANWNMHYYSVSTYEYYANSLLGSYQALFATFPLEGNHPLLDNPIPRTAEPKEGQFFFEVVGTAKGNWVHAGGTYYPDTNNVALVQDSSGDGSYQDFSIGAAFTPTDVQGVYSFLPASSGTHNTDFAQVGADGNTYCYDGFAALNHPPLWLTPQFGGSGTPHIVLLSMPSSTSLQMEIRQAPSCGAAPYSLDQGKAVAFVK